MSETKEKGNPAKILCPNCKSKGKDSLRSAPDQFVKDRIWLSDCPDLECDAEYFFDTQERKLYKAIRMKDEVKEYEQYVKEWWPVRSKPHRRPSE